MYARPGCAATGRHRLERMALPLRQRQKDFHAITRRCHPNVSSPNNMLNFAYVIFREFIRITSYSNSIIRMMRTMVLRLASDALVQPGNVAASGGCTVSVTSLDDQPQVDQRHRHSRIDLIIQQPDDDFQLLALSKRHTPMKEV